MKQKDGIFRQRVGALIEQFICKKYNLFYNKRQRSQGHYDAYNLKSIFEIKASNTTNNAFIIRVNNHKSLSDANGSYVFVSYRLKNKDKALSVITDIEIITIKTVLAKTLNLKHKNICQSFKNRPDKQYVRVYLKEINNLIEINKLDGVTNNVF